MYRCAFLKIVVYLLCLVAYFGICVAYSLCIFVYLFECVVFLLVFCFILFFVCVDSL